MILLILNILALVILTHAYVPQLKTTFKTRATEGVSIFFWLLISLSTSYSLFNLLATGNAEWYTYLAQFINAGVALLLFVWITGLRVRWELTLFITLLYIFLNVYAYQSLPLVVTQTVATIAVILAYVDQIAHFIRTKRADGTNPFLYYYFALGLSVLLSIMFMTDVSMHVIVTELVNITLLLVCGIMSQILGKNNKNKI